MRRLTLMLTLASLFLAAPASAGDDAAKEKLARELMALTGAADIGKQMMEGMANQFRQTPNVPTGFVDAFLELAEPEQLVELIVPLYVRTYDLETLEAAITFYKTPAGKKLIAATPQLTQESMVLGQQWGMELAKQAEAKVAADAAAK